MLRILVIGGTRGIGLAVARNLKEKGHAVTVAGRTKTVEELPTITIDLLQEDSVVSTLSEFGQNGVDALIYSAGRFDMSRSIADYTYCDGQDVFTVNVLGFMASLKALYPTLKKNRGRVIVLNSIAGRVHSQTAGALYTASKYALSGLVRQWSKVLAADGILINSIFLGPMQAGMTLEHLSCEHINKLEQQIPLKRLGMAEDIFPVIEFLLDPKNAYMTGSGIDLNGGLFVSG